MNTIFYLFSFRNNSTKFLPTDPPISARGNAPSKHEEVNKLVVHGHTRQKSDPGTELDNPDRVDKGID